MKRHRPTRGYRAEAAKFAAPQRCWAWLACALGAACSAPAPNPALMLPIVATPITPAPAPPPELADKEDGVPALDAALVERVPEGTFGPYLGSAPDGKAVAVWAALAQSSGWRWYSVLLDAKGTPLAKPRELAEAPSELSLATVTSTPSGYVAVASGVTPTGTRIEALQLGPTGELLGGPTPLVHSRTEVLWVKALNVGKAGVALWATLAVGAADIQLAPLSPSGAQQASSVRVLEGAKAWQAIEYSDGIALAAITVGPNEATRTLQVSFLDGEGRVLGQTTLESGAGLEDQLDAARVGDNLVVSWVRREGVDARVYVASLGPDTHRLTAPEPATPPFGRQRLVELVPSLEPHGQALLAWENVGQGPRGQERVLLAPVDERGRVGAVGGAILTTGDGADNLELTRRGKGLAALTRAVSCARDVTPCATPDPAPTYVELGPDFEVLASEPLRLKPEAGKLADLAWGLRCGAETCSALAALPSSPVPIYGVELRPRSQSWTPVASRVQEAAPRAVEQRALAETEPLADIDTARTGAGWLVASVTQFDYNTPYVRRKTPAPDGKLAPVRALLEVRLVSSDARAEASRVISYRARAASGIALARLNDQRALLVWTALDQQRPEVFTTLLRKDGEPDAQKMLTTNAGDVSELAVAPLNKGSVVAWISDREGEARLFGARLNEQLVKAAPEQRLSPAAGFTGLALARRGNEAWLAATRREEREEQLTVIRLDPQTGARQGDEIAIQRTEASTLSSPVLAARAAGALLGWVERPLSGGGEVARAWLVALDADAQRVGEPVAVLSRLGEPSALRVFCDGAHCQGAIDARPPDGAAIEGFDWPATGAPEARLLAYRASGSADPPALSLTDDGLFYSDRIEQRGVLRRLSVAWR